MERDDDPGPLARGAVIAGTVFGIGLIGAPSWPPPSCRCSTAWFRGAPVFYSTFVLVTAAAAAFVLLPRVPLVPILVLTQVLNAVLLLPLLVLIHRLSRDPEVMGGRVTSRRGASVQLVVIALISLCVAALLVLTVT